MNDIKFEPKDDISFEELVQIVKLTTEMPVPSLKYIFENYSIDVTRHIRVLKEK